MKAELNAVGYIKKKENNQLSAFTFFSSNADLLSTCYVLDDVIVHLQDSQRTLAA
jgi:hypothetical protein